MTDLYPAIGGDIRHQVLAFYLRRCRHLQEPLVVKWHNNADPCNGSTWSLCQSCLDHWLDNADDDPGLEPVRIDWLDAA